MLVLACFTFERHYGSSLLAMDSQEDATAFLREAETPKLISSSLLKSSFEAEFVFDPRFDIGFTDWLQQGPSSIGIDENEVPKDDFVVSGPVVKKPKVSALPLSATKGKSHRLPLSLKKGRALVDTTNKKTGCRFSAPASEEEVLVAAKGVIPTNTAMNTKWAEKNFLAWVEQRATSVPGDPVPADLLKSSNQPEICKYLQCFVLETRKEDGEPYPPASLRSLLSGLNRILQSNGATFSILDKFNPCFRALLKTLDSQSSKLHSHGIGAERKSAIPIQSEHEDLFWEKGLLGSLTPKVLQRTVFFYAGLHYCLRGVQEQYDLRPEQFSRNPTNVTVYNESVYYEYTEFASKNNQHRFKDVNAANKVVRA